MSNGGVDRLRGRRASMQSAECGIFGMSQGRVRGVSKWLYAKGIDRFGGMAWPNPKNLE